MKKIFESDINRIVRKVILSESDDLDAVYKKLNKLADEASKSDNWDKWTKYHNDNIDIFRNQHLEEIPKKISSTIKQLKTVLTRLQKIQTKIKTDDIYDDYFYINYIDEAVNSLHDAIEWQYPKRIRKWASGEYQYTIDR